MASDATPVQTALSSHDDTIYEHPTDVHDFGPPPTDVSGHQLSPTDASSLQLPPSDVSGDQPPPTDVSDLQLPPTDVAFSGDQTHPPPLPLEGDLPDPNTAAKTRKRLTCNWKDCKYRAQDLGDIE